jgi:1,4-dihydroxy-2-naphthoyl-CoA hydrolase
MSIELPLSLEDGFDGLYGLDITDVQPDCMCGQVQVRDELKQPGGLIHGGVYAAMSDSLASTATALEVMPRGKIAVGLSNQTSFLRPITRGMIFAEAKLKHRGRTTWVWEVELTDDDGRLCVLSRVTIGVRDQPAQ